MGPAKLPDIPAFRDALFHALAAPGMQKAAVGELIRGIVVQPTAAWGILCNFQTFFRR